MKKIYCFQTGIYPLGDVIGIGVCEDGVVLSQHVSSSLDWLRRDLASYTDRFDKHCGAGQWEVEWVEDHAHHPGVQRAHDLNQQQMKLEHGVTFAEAATERQPS